MRILQLLLLLLFSGALRAGAQENTPTKDSTIIYPDTVLVQFLDSVGHLPTATLMTAPAHYSDSLFYNQQSINKCISTTDLAVLKEACRNKYIDTGDARRIFPGIDHIIDSQFAGYETIPIRLYSFGSNKYSFTDFAILPGDDTRWDCDLYFFRKDRLLAKHNIYHHYGLEIAHYKDADHRTVVYYKRNYMSGTGISWYNYHFYKFYDTVLAPVLNEIASAYVGQPWSYREANMHATIVQKNPLTIKMVYGQDIARDYNHQLTIQRDDSVMVHYRWDAARRRYEPVYGGKLSKQKILTYYLEQNDLLFLNTNYKLLKRYLGNKRKRSEVLFYINRVKNLADKGYSEWN